MRTKKCIWLKNLLGANKLCFLPPAACRNGKNNIFLPPAGFVLEKTLFFRVQQKFFGEKQSFLSSYRVFNQKNKVYWRPANAGRKKHCLSASSKNFEGKNISYCHPAKILMGKIFFIDIRQKF